MNTLTYVRTADGRLLAQHVGPSDTVHRRPDGTLTKTNFRILHAFENGANTERVSDMLRLGEEVRAVYRAALICASLTPMAYYDAWPKERTLPRLTGFDEQTRRRSGLPTYR